MSKTIGKMEGKVRRDNAVYVIKKTLELHKEFKKEMQMTAFEKGNYSTMYTSWLESKLLSISPAKDCYMCGNGNMPDGYAHICSKCLKTMERSEARSVQMLVDARQKIKDLYEYVNKEEWERLGIEKPYI